MEKTNFSAFGPLLHKYGVDLHLCGHAHNYQRLYPSKKHSMHTVNSRYRVRLFFLTPDHMKFLTLKTKKGNPKTD